jgi:hypothetical protein
MSLWQTIRVATRRSDRSGAHGDTIPSELAEEIRTTGALVPNYGLGLDG